MKCEKFRDIILTDYLDGNISAEKNRQIQEHFKQCVSCRELAAAAKGDIVETFSAAQKVEVPQGLWPSIKTEIENERSKEAWNPLADLLDRLRGLIVFSKPAFALATAMAVIIATVVFTRLNVYNQRVAINDYVEEQVTFLAYLDSDEYYDNGYLDLGTGIEEYLL